MSATLTSRRTEAVFDVEGEPEMPGAHGMESVVIIPHTAKRIVQDDEYADIHIFGAVKLRNGKPGKKQGSASFDQESIAEAPGWAQTIFVREATR